MKSIKVLLIGLMCTGFVRLHAAPAVTHASATPLLGMHLQAGGGGDEKEKKEKSAGRKEKDESTKDAKTNSESTKPSQHARASAKAAIQSAKFTQQQIMARAKVRNFFHNMFNTKYGKPVNFRNTRARNHWSRGHKWR